MVPGGIFNSSAWPSQRVLFDGSAERAYGIRTRAPLLLPTREEEVQMAADQYAPFIPKIKDALARYFTLQGEVPPAEPAFTCLAYVAAYQIDKQNAGFRSSSYDGFASFLVPAFLYDGHRGHQDVLDAIADCESKFATAAAPTTVHRLTLPRGVGRLSSLVKRKPS
jgi:hypothetical protein